MQQLTMKGIYQLTLLLLFSVVTLHAQRKPAPEAKLPHLSVWHTGKPHFEFSLNITRTLSQFLGSGGGVAPSDPYQIGVKWGGKTMIRLGGAVYHLQRREDFFFSSMETFFVKEQNYQFRAGIEQRFIAGKHFSGYIGGDVIYQHERYKSIFTNSFFGRVALEEQINGLGAGGVMGFMYHINKRFSLGTECMLYWMKSNGFKEEPIPGTLEVVQRAFTEQRFIPILPNSLYVIVKF
jgi:hypothetical protein